GEKEQGIHPQRSSSLANEPPILATEDLRTPEAEVGCSRGRSKPSQSTSPRPAKGGTFRRPRADTPGRTAAATTPMPIPPLSSSSTASMPDPPPPPRSVTSATDPWFSAMIQCPHQSTELKQGTTPAKVGYTYWHSKALDFT
ncbi:hypothetical protein EJB05_25618, partial [Eragrostis curvula]